MMSNRLFLFVCLVAPCLPAQVAEKANERYQTEQGRTTIANGLGDSSRDATQKPAELTKAIGVETGMTVADVGTGVGYMLPYLSAAAGPAGKVIGEDIFDDFLAKARKRAEDKNLSNVTFVKGTERSANLPEGKVDLILALDSYHHFNYPQDMLAGFRAALKPGGRLAIVEYYRRPGAMGKGSSAMEHIRLDDAALIKEVEAAGFSLIEEREHIPHSQYIALFRIK
jgi:ubiquinone/menaquinone biosynthesis C-methylase UbiE